MIKLNTLTQPLKLESAKPAMGEAAQRRHKLKQATEAFEAVFINQLLKNMRSVSFTKKEDEGFGKDIMLAMADEGVARQLSKSGMLGVGRVLYEHLLKRLEAEPQTGTGLQITSPYHIDGIAPPRSAAPATPSKDSTIDSPVRPQPNSRTDTRAVPANEPSVNSSARRGRLEKYIEHIQEAARETRLSEELIRAVIKQESGGDTTAVSPKGAAGLMQLMPDTARAVGVNDRFDPRENIMGGARYLRQLVDRFGNLENALAAYNAGPGNVERHNGVPPFPETQNYVRRVLADLSVDK
jgi:Rod binding domain-containing protein